MHVRTVVNVARALLDEDDLPAKTKNDDDVTLETITTTTTTTMITT